MNSLQCATCFVHNKMKFIKFGKTGFFVKIQIGKFFKLRSLVFVNCEYLHCNWKAEGRISSP